MYSYEEMSNIQNMEEQGEAENILENLDSCEKFPHGNDYFI